MKIIDFEDLVFQNVVGMDKDAFLRNAQLMRGPGGFEKPGYCPICKKELVKNEQGDLYCKDFNIGYKKEGGCFWHRYKDGLNYWSEPEEMFKDMAAKNPEFKKAYEKAKEES